mgnify:CR=1 FL=1
MITFCGRTNQSLIYMHLYLEFGQLNGGFYRGTWRRKNKWKSDEIYFSFKMYKKEEMCLHLPLTRLDKVPILHIYKHNLMSPFLLFPRDHVYIDMYSLKSIQSMRVSCLCFCFCFWNKMILVSNMLLRVQTLEGLEN